MLVSKLVEKLLTIAFLFGMLVTITSPAKTKSKSKANTSKTKKPHQQSTSKSSSSTGQRDNRGTGDPAYTKRTLRPGEKRCPPNTFECGSHECTALSSQCDGKEDCIDGSDEKNCGRGHRIKDKKGVYREVEDEVPDNFMCPKGLHTCANKECVVPGAKCDGRKDCTDGSDEWGCKGGQRKKKPEETIPGCPRGTFACKNTECILESYVCDGRSDCADGSDEFPEECKKKKKMREELKKAEEDLKKYDDEL